jgi:hypothetical protein
MECFQHGANQVEGFSAEQSHLFLGTYLKKMEHSIMQPHTGPAENAESTPGSKPASPDDFNSLPMADLKAKKGKR